MSSGVLLTNEVCLPHLRVPPAELLAQLVAGRDQDNIFIREFPNALDSLNKAAALISQQRKKTLLKFIPWLSLTRYFHYSQKVLHHLGFAALNEALWVVEG